MKEIIIRLDYLQGPIQKDEFDLQRNQLVTGVEIIDNDIVLQTLDNKAEEIYSSLYGFDKYGQPCVFDEGKFEAEKPRLLALISTILQRLETVNDGSFIIKNEEADRLIVNSIKVS